MTPANNEATLGLVAVIREGGSFSDIEDQKRAGQWKPWCPIQLSRQQRYSQAIRYRSCHVIIVLDGGRPPVRSNVFRNNAQILSSRLACDLCRIACCRYWGCSCSFQSSEWRWSLKCSIRGQHVPLIGKNLIYEGTSVLVVRDGLGRISSGASMKPVGAR